MGIEVYTGLDHLTSWSRPCNGYAGFQVYVYDTDKPRPGGSNNPYSNNYKYYPASGALVRAHFISPTGWEEYDVKRIGNDVAWVMVGTSVPCYACKGYNVLPVRIRLYVEYKDLRWHNTFNILKVDCAGGAEQLIIQSMDCKVENGKVGSAFKLNKNATIKVKISLYASNDNKNYKILDSKLVYLDNTYRYIEFNLPNYKYLGIAPYKENADKDWICSKDWTIRR